MRRSRTRSSSRHSWWRAGALLALLAPLVVASGAVMAQDADSTPEAGPAYYADTEGPAQPGGTANFLLYEDPDGLNPLVGNTSIALQVSTAILEGLTYNDPDGNFQPALAAELPNLDNGGVSEDLKTVTWKLKPDLLWSDGEPVTSADVKHTWEAVRDAANGSAFASEYELITDLQTPDPATVVVTYSAFNAGYLDQFPWIVPQHATGPAEEMATWDFNRNPIGTGPFKLQEWAAGEYLATVKNENYREEGKPYLDGINFLVVPAEEARTARMIEGDGDVMLWAGDEAEEQIEAASAGMGRTAPGIWVVEMRFNLSQPFDDDPGATPPHPILGDLRVREALATAVNRERIITELFENRVFHIDSPFDVGWMACQVEPFTYDPERAKTLLDEAGWTDDDGDGVREAHGVADVADGTPLSLMMNGYTGYSPLELIELAIQEDLKAVGVDVKLENQEFAVIFGTWDDASPRLLGDYDILVYDAGWFAEPGKEIVQDLHPEQVPSAQNPGGRNIYRWVREDVGEWFDTANGTPDVAVRRENFCNAASAYREDIVSLPVLQFSEGSVYANRIHGYTVSTWEYAPWDAENWWVEG
ncbi:MAG: peptide ABC transporter substrate-binding protein [Chloroflexia bacterium]|nr:peptide ABC transporter substrate-binding protein [Chloroflexia bacterium]